MGEPSQVSVARTPDLSERSWDDVRQAVVGNDAPTRSDELLCCVAVFGHGDGVLDGIQRVSLALAATMPAQFRGRVVVQAASSLEPEADTPGTLYLDCLFRPDTRPHLADNIYRWVLATAIPAAVPAGARGRVIWRKDDEIASVVMTAASSPADGVH